MKRITTILTFLMLLCMGAWAAYGPTTSQTISLSASTGTFAQGNSTWNRTWTSTQTFPRLTLSTTTTGSDGNVFMPISDETYSLDIRNGFEYNFSVSEGYIITSYRVTATAQETANKITVNGVETDFAVGVENYVEVNVNARSTTSGTNSFRVSNNKAFYANIEVNIKWDPITASSQFSNSKVYTVTNNRSSCSWMVRNGGSSISVNYSDFAYSNTDAKQQFAFIKSSKSGSEQIYLYSVSAGKFVKKDNTMSVTDGDPLTFSASTYTNGSGVAYPLFMKFDDDHVINTNSGGTGLVFDTWGGSRSGSGIDEGNSFAVIPAGSYDLTQAIKNLEKGKYVTYKVYYNGSEVLSEDNVLAHVDDAPSLPTSMQRDYCTYTYYSDEERTEELDAVTSSSNTIYVNATWDGPFNISSDFANAEWYLLRMKGATLNMKYQDGSSAYPLEAIASYNIDEEDYYAWAFTGNPYDGFEILNRQAGSTKKLYQGATVNNGDYPTMSADNESSWLVTRYSDTEFSVNPSGYTKYWNAWNGGATVQYWKDGITDPGSRLSVLPEGSIDFTSMVESYIVPYILNASDKYFAISSTDAATLVADYADGGSKTSWNKSEYQSFKSALDAAMKLPTTGYYRIKSNDANVYLNAVNGSQLTYNGSGTEPSSIVYMTGSGNTFKLKMQGKNVVPQSNGSPVVLNNSEYTLTLSSPVVNGAIVPGRVNIGTDATATNYLVRDTSPNVNSLNPTSNVAAAQWIIEDATSATVSLTAIGDNTYATTYLPFDVRVSGSDVTANAVVEADVHVGYVVPTALKDNKIPAGTPVILRGANTSATSATLNINTGDAFSAISGTSALEGVYVNTDFSLSETDDESNSCTADYFLGMLDSALGFYRSGIESKTGYYTLGANRAYLSADVVAAAGARGFAIKWNDDEVTGIRTIDNGQKTLKNGAFYDLSGRRVQNPQHGLYIVNGKKVVIK